MGPKNTSDYRMKSRFSTWKYSKAVGSEDEKKSFRAFADTAHDYLESKPERRMLDQDFIMKLWESLRMARELPQQPVTKREAAKLLKNEDINTENLIAIIHCISWSLHDVDSTSSTGRTARAHDENTNRDDEIIIGDNDGDQNNIEDNGDSSWGSDRQDAEGNDRDNTGKAYNDHRPKRIRSVENSLPNRDEMTLGPLSLLRSLVGPRDDRFCHFLRINPSSIQSPLRGDSCSLEMLENMEQNCTPCVIPADDWFFPRCPTRREVAEDVTQWLLNEYATARAGKLSQAAAFRKGKPSVTRNLISDFVCSRMLGSDSDEPRPGLTKDVPSATLSMEADIPSHLKQFFQLSGQQELALSTNFVPAGGFVDIHMDMAMWVFSLQVSGREIWFSWRPTEHNMKIANRYDIWLHDNFARCAHLLEEPTMWETKPGDLSILPEGVIYAVFTEKAEDSLLTSFGFWSKRDVKRTAKVLSLQAGSLAVDEAKLIEFEAHVDQSGVSIRQAKEIIAELRGAAR